MANPPTRNIQLTGYGRFLALWKTLPFRQGHFQGSGIERKSAAGPKQKWTGNTVNFINSSIAFSGTGTNLCLC